MRLLYVLFAYISLLPSVHAEPSNVATALVIWQGLRDPDTPGIAFSDGWRFLNEHPDWPDEKVIRLRTEAAALFEKPDSAVMAKFCTEDPISGRGMIACVRANARDAESRKGWLHKGWIQGDFNEAEEKTILRLYEDQLSGTDHLARIERLLYEEKATSAKRMLTYVPKNKHALFLARIAVIQKDRHAKKIVSALPAAERSNIGLTFDRANRAVSEGKEEDLVALLKSIPATAPYPELWWPLRNIAIREALSKRNFQTALGILSNRGALKDEQEAEALWLKGWLTLEYKHDPANAHKEFHALYTQVKTPVSRSRAAFWASRAAMKNGNREIAEEWLQKAAGYPTVFYGQLAQQMLNPNTPIALTDTPSATSEDQRVFEQDERVTAVRLLNSMGETVLRDRFLTHLGNTLTSPGQLLLLSVLARETGGTSKGVKIAKLALRKKILLLDSGWPRVELPQDLSIEPALALAIARQESEFDPEAQSGANARGLMQLLPSTARHIATQNGWDYNDAALTNPATNLTLGSAYLGQIIRGFDGSYVLGIASYNAGPASVRRWIAERGLPPKTVEGTLNWIESIPYSETRNYVMRALENLQLYRRLSEPNTPIRLTEDLLR